MDKRTNRWRSWKPGTALAIGLVLGAVLGLLLDRFGLWVSIGLMFGLIGEGAIQAARKKRSVGPGDSPP